MLVVVCSGGSVPYLDREECWSSGGILAICEKAANKVERMVGGTTLCCAQTVVVVGGMNS